jgi:hypothetical protein
MSEADSRAEMDMDYLIGMALRYGVMFSVALLLIGIALLARDGASSSEVLGASSPLNTSTIHVPAVFSGIPSLDPLSFIVLGACSPDSDAGAPGRARDNLVRQGAGCALRLRELLLS